MADKIGTDEYGEILIYQTDDGQTNIEVKIEDDTVWLTQQQLTELYQCSKSNISEHIKHIFEEGELDKDSVVRKFRTTADDGKTYNVTYYNLDRGIFYLCKTFADIVPEVSIPEKRNGAWQKIYPSLNAGTGGRGRNYFR